MKRIYFLIACLFVLSAFSANAQDYILIPENFILQKGDNLNIHLISANQFTKQDEIKYETANAAKFLLTAGKKKIDLSPMAKDTASPIVSVKLDNEGLNMIQMIRKTTTDEIERDDFLKILDDEGLTKESEKAKNGSKDSFREKYTWYLKSLVEVYKNSANGFDKPLKDEFEIVLKDNPYKGNYGDDMIAKVLFRDNPLVNATVFLYIKTAKGAVFAEKFFSDKDGQVYFKLTREGIYVLRAGHLEASKDKSADFETWLSTYSFAFSSSNELPNTYKEFGFGNKH